VVDVLCCYGTVDVCKSYLSFCFTTNLIRPIFRNVIAGCCFRVVCNSMEPAIVVVPLASVCGICGMMFLLWYRDDRCD